MIIEVHFEENKPVITTKPKTIHFDLAKYWQEFEVWN